MLPERIGFRPTRARVGLVKADLALEVRPLDEVAIDERQLTDSRAGQLLGALRAERATADDEDTSVVQSLLGLLAAGEEQRLAVVAVLFGTF